MKKLGTLIIFFTIFYIKSFSQNSIDTTNKIWINKNNSIENSAIDLLKRDGKIYTVIAVLCIILIGLFIYLWQLDKKLTRIEKNL